MGCWALVLRVVHELFCLLCSTEADAYVLFVVLGLCGVERESLCEKEGEQMIFFAGEARWELEESYCYCYHC